MAVATAAACATLSLVPCFPMLSVLHKRLLVHEITMLAHTDIFIYLIRAHALGA